MLATVGCGSSGDAQPSPTGGPAVNSDVRLATCADWNRASVPERRGTVGELGALSGGPVAGQPARGPVLGARQAYDLLERYCAQPYARGFKLYKLYDRAAGFVGR